MKALVKVSGKVSVKVWVKALGKVSARALVKDWGEAQWVHNLQSEVAYLSWLKLDGLRAGAE